MAIERWLTIHYGYGDPCFYALDDRGQILETTFTRADGGPDWDEATYVDVGRFADVEELSRATLALLQALDRFAE